MKERAINLIKKHGTSGVHAMMLKRQDRLTDFMSVCSRIIFALDMFESYSLRLTMYDAARIIDSSGLSAKELIELNEYLSNFGAKNG